MDRYSNSHSSGKFTFLWSNNAEGTAPMLSKQLKFPSGTLSCKQLAVDRVTVVMRPTASIKAFDPPDTSASNWQVETYNLMIRLNHSSSSQNPCYVFRSDTQQYPIQLQSYGVSLIREADIHGDEDSYALLYKPNRDSPLAVDVKDLSELDLTLLFPLYGGNLPDYRVDSIMVELSYS